MGDKPSIFRTKSRPSYGAQLGTRLEPKAWKAAYNQPPRKPFVRVRSEDFFLLSSMANRMRSSATPPLSCGKSNTALLDDGTVDTLSSNGARKMKSPRASVTRAEKHRHRASPKLPRNRLSTDAPGSPFPNHHRPLGGMVNQKPLDAAIAEFAGLTRVQTPPHYQAPRPVVKRVVSSPTPIASLPTNEVENGHTNMQLLQDVSVQGTSGDVDMSYHSSDLKSLTPSSSGPTEDDGYQEMFKQPKTNHLSEEELIKEVRGIYAGLVKLEQKCIEVDKEQTESKTELSGSQWQAMINLHQQLLYEHQDFFLASKNSASSVLRPLAEKYAMPARMWRFGIHSFLELLRQKLPKSLEFMLNFIYIAYSMMTLLLESVADFRGTWIECLGDLARYRMAIEESDLGEREIWAGVSRYWYNLDADESPDVGRIQHHLAVLSRPDGLQQLFYYTKALVSVQPFQNARDSITLLFNPYKGQELNQRTVADAFIATHGVLFSQGPAELFVASASHFFTLLRRDIRLLREHTQYGVYIMSCNFASILNYGQAEAVMALEFSQKQEESLSEVHKLALEWTLDSTPTSETSILPFSPIASQGSSLTFQTLAILLDGLDEEAMSQSFHISMAFIWCLALRPLAMQQLERVIPWTRITRFLNTILHSDKIHYPDTDFAKFESETFPIPDDVSDPWLPEDFFIRGQVWSQLYYPKNFFDGAPCEDSRPTMEAPMTIVPRRQRCIWLGARIATFRRWITYSREERFIPTNFAHDVCSIAESHSPINSNALLPVPTTDLNMGGT